MEQKRDEQFTISINLAADLGLADPEREALSRAVNQLFVNTARGLRGEISRLLQAYGIGPDEDSDLDFGIEDGPDTAKAVANWLSNRDA